MNIGIFYGSDTGNTENVAISIQERLGKKRSKIFNIMNCDKNSLKEFDILLLGIPTWYYGEPQCDWDNFFPILKQTSLIKKSVAIFGCGDQEDYSEYFCDAMGIIGTIVTSCGANIIGHWPNLGYHFESSKGLVDSNHFIGLAIDEDRQSEMTSKRIDQWVKQICNELCL